MLTGVVSPRYDQKLVELGIAGKEGSGGTLQGDSSGLYSGVFR